MASPDSIKSLGGHLQIKGIKKSFGSAVVLEDVAFDVQPGERHGMIGVNGAGKSTLFNIITGDLSMDAGSILLDGEELNNLSVQKRVLRGLGRTYQVSSLAQSLTVGANLVLSLGDGRLPSLVTPWRDALSEDALRESAKRFDLEDSLEDRVEDLSHGMQRQLELAMVIHRRPRVLLLDEPAAGLSPRERGRLSATIRELPADVSLLIIEHDVDMILDLCDPITVLHNGRILMSGSPKEVARDARVREAYLGYAHA